MVMRDRLDARGGIDVHRGRDRTASELGGLTGEQLDSSGPLRPRAVEHRVEERPTADHVQLLIEEARRITDPAGAIAERDIAPTNVDIRWSNICNFKCRMCWHRSSSSWFDDAQQIAAEADAAANITNPEQSARRLLVWGERPVVSCNKSGHAVDKIAPYLGELVSVCAAGGEPLMMDEHFEFLERLLPRASEIQLEYYTACPSSIITAATSSRSGSRSPSSTSAHRSTDSAPSASISARAFGPIDSSRTSRRSATPSAPVATCRTG